MKVNSRLIRELRLQKSWSQEKLADIAGLNLRTVQRIETNGVASLQARLSIAKSLGIDPVELDRNEDRPVQSPNNAAPVPHFLVDARVLLVGLYAALAILSCGLVVLDYLYASQIVSKFSYTEAAPIFSRVSDVLLQFGFITMLAGVAAVYVTWQANFVRVLLIASIGVKLVIGIVALVLMNMIASNQLVPIDQSVGILIRLGMHVASTALALVACVEYYGHRRGIRVDMRRN